MLLFFKITFRFVVGNMRHTKKKKTFFNRKQLLVIELCLHPVGKQFNIAQCFFVFFYSCAEKIKKNQNAKKNKELSTKKPNEVQCTKRKKKTKIRTWIAFSLFFFGADFFFLNQILPLAFCTSCSKDQPSSTDIFFILFYFYFSNQLGEKPIFFLFVALAFEAVCVGCDKPLSPLSHNQKHKNIKGQKKKFFFLVFFFFYDSPADMIGHDSSEQKSHTVP